MRLAALAMFVCSLSCARSPTPEVRAGDLVFHRSRSAQSRAIAEVTGSQLTHVGLVLEHDGELQVLEAGSPVQWTQLETWIARGEGGHVEVRRSHDALSTTQLDALAREGQRLVGRPYDARFEWGDRRVYCSELVYVVFERALDIRLVTPQRWRDLALTPAARRLAARRLGGAPRAEQQVVTPVALAESPLLYAVR